MFDVGATLQAGLDAARKQLAQAQGDVARANASGSAGRAADAAMARAAEAALFTEALLSAQRARLAEIQTAAK